MTELDVTSARLLVIEDNAIDALNMIENLAVDNDEVKRVASGRAGFEAAGRDDPDLVICSLNLDDDDALRLLSQFRAHEPTRHLPILMVGADAPHDTLAKALELGPHDYLLKPVARNKLR